MEGTEEVGTHPFRRELSELAARIKAVEDGGGGGGGGDGTIEVAVGGQTFQARLIDFGYGLAGNEQGAEGGEAAIRIEPVFEITDPDANIVPNVVTIHLEDGLVVEGDGEGVAKISIDQDALVAKPLAWARVGATQIFNGGPTVIAELDFVTKPEADVVIEAHFQATSDQESPEEGPLATMAVRLGITIGEGTPVPFAEEAAVFIGQERGGVSVTAVNTGIGLPEGVTEDEDGNWVWHVEVYVACPSGTNLFESNLGAAQGFAAARLLS